MLIENDVIGLEKSLKKHMTILQKHIVDDFLIIFKVPAYYWKSNHQLVGFICNIRNITKFTSNMYTQALKER